MGGLGWEEGGGSGGGGGGGESLAETLAIGQNSGGNADGSSDVVLDSGDQIRGPGNVGTGFQVFPGDTQHSFAMGGASMGSGQYAYLLGGPISLAATFDNGYAPSIIWGDNFTGMDVDTMGLGGLNVSGEFHNWDGGNPPYMEYCVVGGLQHDYSGGGYVANSLIVGSSIFVNGDIVDAAIVGNFHNLEEVSSGYLVTGAGQRVNVDGQGFACFGNSCYANREGELLWGNSHGGLAGSGNGEAQGGVIHMAAHSTGTSPVFFSLDSAISVSHYALRENSVYSFSLQVSAMCKAGAANNEGASWQGKGMIRLDGAGNITLESVDILDGVDVGGETVRVYRDSLATPRGPSYASAGMGGSTLEVLADDGDDSLRLRLVGLAAHTIDATARIDFAEASRGVSFS